MLFKLTCHQPQKIETLLNRQRNNRKLSYESRLLCCHVRREKKSCTTRVSLMQPPTISFRWSKGSRKAHNCIQWTVIWITCKTWKVACLLNTILFLQFHIDQQIAETPMRILALVFYPPHLTNFQTYLKHWWVEEYYKYKTLHAKQASLANGQAKN